MNSASGCFSRTLPAFDQAATVHLSLGCNTAWSTLRYPLELYRLPCYLGAAEISVEAPDKFVSREAN